MHIALVGNLSEGFRVFGPFESFDAAATWADGKESWIMGLDDPEAETRREQALKTLEGYADGLGLTAEDLDEEVHDAKGDEAAKVDNSGMREQLECLLDGPGDLSHRVTALKARLKELAK